MARAHTKASSPQIDPVRHEAYASDSHPFTEEIEQRPVALNAGNGTSSENSHDNNSARESHGQENHLGPLVEVCGEREKASIFTNEFDAAHGITDHQSRPRVASLLLQDLTENTSLSPIHASNTTDNTQTEDLLYPIPISEVTPVMNWLASGCYFSYMIGVAAIGAYFSYIFSEKGVSKSVIGILLSIIPISSVAILPLFSFIADKYHCAILLLVISVVLTIIVVWFYTTAPNRVVLEITFVILVILQTPINPLVDRNMLAMFPSSSKTTKWAFIRSFGAIGWGIGNVVASAVAYRFGSWSIGVIQYTVGHAGMLLCIWLLKLKKDAIDKARKENVKSIINTVDGGATPVKVKFMDVLRIIFGNPRLLALLIASSVMGMGYSIINAFLFIFLGEIGGSVILFGITILFTVSTEIPIFIFFGYIERWFCERTMISMAMALWAVRVAGYSLLHNPWLVLLLEPLHGVSFGLMWLPGIKTVAMAFPPHLSSSATGVLFFFVAGVGAAFGCIVAGVINGIVGSRRMFQICTLAMVACLITYQIVDRLLSCRGWKLYPKESAPRGPVASEEACSNRLEDNVNNNTSCAGANVRQSVKNPNSNGSEKPNSS